MHLEKFISYLQHEKRYSPHTILSYRNDLEQFAAYLKETYSIELPEEVKHFHIRSWMVGLMDSCITPRSINRKISSIKSYYKFLLRNGKVRTDPTLKIISPKTSKRLPVYVEKEDAEKMLEKHPVENDFTAKRDSLILELFYVTGMRLSELINLKESDVNWGRKDIKVLGKGNKQRVIPVNQPLLDSVNNYLKLKKPDFGNEHLLVTDSGKKLYPKFVYRKVNQFLSQVTTVDKKSPHTMRHTFATHLVNSGADLNAVKELLGHSSLAATQVYTHNSIEKLKDVYKKAHPKA